MKDLKIETRKVQHDNDNSSTMIDLIIDGEKIETGDNPISSFAFWDDMEGLAHRSIHKIKKDNPKLKFDFSIDSMLSSKAEQEIAFVKHVLDKFPNLDIEKFLTIFDEEINKITVSHGEDEHPNPDLKIPINSHMVKMIMLAVINSYLVDKK